MPRLVMAAVAAFVGLCALWSVAAPLAEAPDEQHHLGFVLYLAEGNDYPDYDEVQVQSATIWLCRTYAASTKACPRPAEFANPVGPVRRHLAEDAPPKSRRLAWDDEGGDNRLKSINQMGQHPPLYYEAMATALRLERAVTGGNWSLDRELAMLRLLNVLIVAPIPLLAWWGATRFGLGAPVATAAACAMLGLPMLTHIGSVLNNDNLVVVLGAALVALLAGVVRGDRRMGTALAIGGVLGAALLSKSLAAVFPPLVAVAYVLGWWNQRREAEPEPFRASVRPLAASAGLTLLLTGWWYLRVRLRTGQFAPTIESRNYVSSAAPPGFTPDPAGYVYEFAKLMNVRVWGSFGWHTVRLPGELALVLSVAAIVAVTSALWPRLDTAGNGRASRTFLLLPSAALLVFVAGRAWNLYSLTGRYPFIQGRYLLAGAVGVAVLVASGVERFLRRWTPLAISLAAGLLQSLALALCIRTYWGAPGAGIVDQVRAMTAWSGWPGEMVGALLLAAVLGGLWFAYELVSDLRSEST